MWVHISACLYTRISKNWKIVQISQNRSPEPTNGGSWLGWRIRSRHHAFTCGDHPDEEVCPYVRGHLRPLWRAVSVFVHFLCAPAALGPSVAYSRDFRQHTRYTQHTWHILHPQHVAKSTTREDVSVLVEVCLRMMLQRLASDGWGCSRDEECSQRYALGTCRGANDRLSTYSTHSACARGGEDKFALQTKGIRWICLYTCMYVFVYIYVHIYIDIFLCMYINMYIYIYIYLYRCIYT